MRDISMKFRRARWLMKRQALRITRGIDKKLMWPLERKASAIQRWAEREPNFRRGKIAPPVWFGTDVLASAAASVGNMALAFNWAAAIPQTAPTENGLKALVVLAGVKYSHDLGHYAANIAWRGATAAVHKFHTPSVT